MDSGLVEGEPGEKPDSEVDPHITNPEPPEAEGQPDKDRAQRECTRIQIGRIDERDDQNRTDIVDDSQRKHEHTQAVRNASAQKCEASHDEGDVGGHDDAPAALAGISELQRKVEQRRNDQIQDYLARITQEIKVETIFDPPASDTSSASLPERPAR